MRTRRLIAAAMAAALTLTAAPSYTVSRTPALMSAYAADAADTVTIDGTVYALYGDHSEVTGMETPGTEIHIAAAIETAAGSWPVTAIAEGAFDGCTDIWFEGNIDGWNSISEKPFIPEGTTLHCRDTASGEYITACTVNVRFEDLVGEPVSGINALVRYNSSEPRIVSEWVSGEGTVTIAVPMNEGEGQYTVSHDAAENYYVYTDSSTGIGFSEGNTSCSRTIVVDDENIVPYDLLAEDGTLITAGDDMIICVPGENISLGGTDNGVMSCKLLRKEKEEAFYRLKANTPGEFTLIVASDDRETDENVKFIVVPEEEETTATKCGGANIVQKPDEDVIVGDFTTMMVYGYGYRPMIKVYGQGDEYTIDSEGKFVEIEELSRSGDYTTYKLTTKQICRFEPAFYLSNFMVTIDSGVFVDVREEVTEEEVRELIEAPEEEPVNEELPEEPEDVPEVIAEEPGDTQETSENVKKLPDVEMAVGQSRTVTIPDTGHHITVRVFGHSDDFTYDMDGCFIEVKEISRENGNTTYEIIPRKPCRGEVCFEQPADNWAAEAWFKFRVVEGDPVAAGSASAEQEEMITADDRKGDANTDGKVNVADSVKVLQFISNQNKYPMTAKQRILSDIDGIEGLTGGDAVTIQKIDAGIIKTD